MIHHFIRHSILFVLPVVALAGCANGAESSGRRVSLYKSHGAVQCESRGAPLSATERQLAQAGIRVLTASCGNDGMVRPAVCGSPNGSIHIVEVPLDQAEAALALGLARLSDLPDATLGACR